MAYSRLELIESSKQHRQIRVYYFNMLDIYIAIIEYAYYLVSDSIFTSYTLFITQYWSLINLCGHKDSVCIYQRTR